MHPLLAARSCPGSWVAYCLLQQGYKVRGTVRSLSNEAKVAHLRDLCPGSTYKMELVEANLTSDEGWSDAVKVSEEGKKE